MFNKKSIIELKKDLDNESFYRKTCSFYKYITIKSPKELRNYLYIHFSELKILGRIYVSKEGINAQISIPEHNIDKFEKYILTMDILKDVKFKYAIKDGHSFIKLKVLLKEEIVAYKLSDEQFDMNNVGKYLSPIKFHRSIQQNNSIIVDMRNYYESEVGNFKDALIPDAHYSEELLPKVDKMLQKHKDKKIHLYCTGGIRCEKASSYLIKKGYKNVFQLSGGIIQYAHDIKEKKLESLFIGKNFVFDDRLSERVTTDIIAKCHQCFKPSDNHKNCKNDTCHILFIQCDECSLKFEDCCSFDCKNFKNIDFDERELLRKDKNKKVTSAKLSAKFRPKLYKLFNYWK
mgnify:FL=1